MLLRFELTVPNVGSWNGQDTGNKNGYYIWQSVKKDRAESIIDKSFYYNFGDGWGANIKVEKIGRSKSNGFRNYDWMVDEIVRYGKIQSVKLRDTKYKIQATIGDILKGEELTKEDTKFLMDGLL